METTYVGLPPDRRMLCLAKNIKAKRPREQAAQDPDPVESAGETGHPFADWVPCRRGRVCVWYASQDRKEILAEAKVAASSTMGHDGKISDHVTIGYAPKHWVVSIVIL